ncbi:hypothetical protein CR513_39660, partial [Mucuna pruriens]
MDRSWINSSQTSNENENGVKSFSTMLKYMFLIVLEGSIVKDGWTGKSFTELLELLKDVFLEGNILPNCNYEVKKILYMIGMDYKKIHVCPNDCILYGKQFEVMHECSKCGESQYKKKDGDCSSHVSTKGPSMELQHVTDSMQWKKIDNLFLDFSNKPRNLRICLAINRMNLHGNLVNIVHGLFYWGFTNCFLGCA